MCVGQDESVRFALVDDANITNALFRKSKLQVNAIANHDSAAERAG